MVDYQKTQSGLEIQDLPLAPTNEKITCDVSLGYPRPIVPEKWRRRIFDTLHNLSHPSIRETIRQITNKFVWKNIRKDVQSWAKSCISCQSSKVQFHTKSKILKIPMPNKRFEEIHIDIVGPLPQSQGATHNYNYRPND